MVIPDFAQATWFTLLVSFFHVPHNLNTWACNWVLWVHQNIKIFKLKILLRNRATNYAVTFTVRVRNKEFFTFFIERQHRRRDFLYWFLFDYIWLTRGLNLVLTRLFLVIFSSIFLAGYFVFTVNALYLTRGWLNIIENHHQGFFRSSMLSCNKFLILKSIRLPLGILLWWPLIFFF